MSEIIALELPAIFVPSPFVTNNHQYKNANDLATKNAGIILEEQHFNWENLNKQINYVLLNKEKYQEIKNNLKKLAVTDSSERIYNILKEMITHDKKHI
jgi:UDP-N-acetylglucosamine--N-acetylmuramyl-(pentapeptide) pyrophosphoryl-undecaprenol N-acetylglucosamine transferase